MMGKAFVIAAVFFLSLAHPLCAQEPLAQAFIEAVRSNNPKLLKQWLPTPALIRQLEPTRTKGLSDAAIRQKYITPLQNKLVKDFANFQASAQKNGMDMSKLRYDSFQLQRDDASTANKPLACSINYSYENKQGSFSITVLEKQKKWALFEVLLSVNIFDKLK